ncbi:phage tail sheath family protein [Clostridium oceanicum]|uniref:Phage tail sheath family protein n=1 Tax=Clostridium oceanicum TaxID=1543 RepID=A0ABN1JC85_9CLOT
MATGTWNEKDRKNLPGFYNRFKTKAEERLGSGIHGIVAMPVKSNWGPVKKVFSVKDLKELKKLVGDNSDFTAYKLGRLAILGNPKELLLCRLTDGTEKTETLTLKNEDQKECITLETKYPTDRNFNVTIKPNLIEIDKKDFIFYEGTKALFTINALSGAVEEIIKKINSNVENNYVVAKKVADVNGVLESIVNIPLTGGNNGISNVTNQNYLDAMSEFEKYKIDGFCLDGITDSSLHNAVKEWVIKNKELGINVIAYLGGAKEEKIEQANTRSKQFNYENIVNIYGNGVYEGITYTPAETACYVAGLATGQQLKESLCNQKTIFEDVEPKLKAKEIEYALAAGTLVLSIDDNDVVVVDDVNTLKNYPDDKSDVFGSIRAVKFMNAVDTDTAMKRKGFVGKFNNGDTGRTLIICALKRYFETLAKENVIDKNFTVQVDKELQETAKPEEFFWKWDAKYLDVIKKIYGTGYVRR